MTLHLIKTQALQINEETYSIAVACLPGGFVTIPFDNVKGSWLIVNHPEDTFADGNSESPVMTLGNAWVTEDDFKVLYEVINKKSGRPAENSWVEIADKYDEKLADRYFLTGQKAQSRSTNRRIRTRPRYTRYNTLED